MVDFESGRKHALPILIANSAVRSDFNYYSADAAAHELCGYVVGFALSEQQFALVTPGQRNIDQLPYGVDGLSRLLD